MNDPAKAAFSFDNFKIISFFLNESKGNGDNLSISILPSGSYFENEGLFEVTMTFNAFEDGETITPLVNVVLKAKFNFDNKLEFEEIPNYFYLNSIAIVFPYLRAFLSTLTLQANIKPIILPVLNLKGLDQPLRENTKVIK